jgi:hypothetical protein
MFFLHRSKWNYINSNNSEVPCTRSAKNNTDQSLQSKGAEKSTSKTEKISGHPYKVAGVSTNHDNNNQRKRVLLSTTKTRIT